MCKVPKQNRNEKYPFRSEIVEIGAVLLNEELEITDTFKTYVAPEYGEIDEFIHRLTGISNDDIKDAPMIEDALMQFVEWIPENAVLVSWSFTDADQIEREMKLKDIHIPGMDEYLDDWLDCQGEFGDMMNTDKNYSLSEALIIADIDYKDGAHDGLIDAYNTALLFSKMEQESDLQLSSYYVTENDAQYSGYNSGLLSNMVHA